MRNNLNGKIIAVDIDDTYVELVKEWLKLYNKEWDDTLKKEDITDWNIGSFTKAGDGFYKYLFDKDLYKNMELVDGAKDIILRLKEEGVRIIFVTASFHEDKFDLLKRTEVIAREKDFFVAKDKSLINADVLIDDNYDNIKNFPRYGILLDKPWNRKYNDVCRAMNWEEVGKLLFKKTIGEKYVAK